ncbi:UPF0481 protein At3g47200-like [Prosopis cineraria]|uniref:UPF0481 protein At3g47200-like n=1 Tax=Prosopis cineraria TaxID=364024 RepID=UPI00240FE660|nr:UPF0481 protein At3g47200-like [Prosopis cineraria]
MTENNEDGLSSDLCCIYKVPLMICLLKPDAYTPQVVSISPFHHGDLRLEEMERHKQIVFKRFAKRAMTDLDTLVNYLEEELEPKVRASHSKSIQHNKKELVELIIVDAVFIIELFRMLYEDDDEVKNDAKLSQSWLLEAILIDFLLLENQLPFFFLEKLFDDIAFPPKLRGHLPSLLDLTYCYFGHHNVQTLKPNPDVRIKHCTDLLRLFYLPKETKPEKRQPFKMDGSSILLYSENELREAGVKLKASTSKCLLDLKFSKPPILKIPKIYVGDDTETSFCDMVALE